jgi:hypothetical protein
MVMVMAARSIGDRRRMMAMAMAMAEVIGVEREMEVTSDKRQLTH